MVRADDPRPVRTNGLPPFGADVHFPKYYKKFVVVEGFKKFPEMFTVTCGFAHGAQKFSQKSATCLLATSSSLSPLVVSHLLVLQMSYDSRKYRSKMAQEEYKTSQFSSDYNLNLF